ncbi:DNA (cytosine-5-)-methyltransferase [Nitrospiraceae bacterium HYJII51-Mn-bac16s-1-B09]|uniref:Cytosine-specific methyltransferase n=2 Tax=Candidatus Manganitrophus noduliformans TaxID=2606439 RepID=A0A7X6DQ56_9BACT|nr:DNA (cytosine-5-)-methyltransferase [Candidatus Manganitrophus noduliformans]
MIKTEKPKGQGVPIRKPVQDTPIFSERKCFSAEHKAWRRRMLRWIRERTDLFPDAVKEKKNANLREHLDESVINIWLVARILSIAQGDPDLGRNSEAIDGFIYVLLAQKVDDCTSQKVLAALRCRFETWDQFLRVESEEIEFFVSTVVSGPRKAAFVRSTLENVRRQLELLSFEAAPTQSDSEIDRSLGLNSGLTNQNNAEFVRKILGISDFVSNADAIRVLERLEPYSYFGFNLRGVSLREKKILFSDAIPPHLRYSLRVNLAIHGREICKVSKPKCDRCPVNNFCAYFRTVTSTAFMVSRKPTVIDLFCGAGGLSAGFREAGFRTILAVDQDPASIRTFRINHPEVPDNRVICADLRDLRKSEFAGVKSLLASETVDVLVGGPPCQGFSRAGWRSRGTGHRYEGTDDDRNHLYQELVSLLRIMQPKVVLMENVPGIGEVRFGDGTSFQDLARKAMQDFGYKTAIWTLNSAWYGVPQNRIRRVIIGSNLGVPPDRPESEYRIVTDSSDQESLEPAITLLEAIGDLPELAINDGSWVSRYPTSFANMPARFLQRYAVLHPQGLLFSHVTRFQNKKDLERFDTLSPGETYMDLIERRPDLKNYRTDAFDDKYYRLLPDAPCRTIVAHLRRDGNSFVHPSQLRSLSVREAARIQSFPDNFIFTGSRGSQFEQIGNAVPPLMARAMARTILLHLQKHGIHSMNGQPVNKRGASPFLQGWCKK